MEEYEQARKIQIINLIKNIVLEHVEDNGTFSTIVPDLYFVRKNKAVSGQHCISQPMAFLCLQGHKSVNYGNYIVNFSSGTCGVLCVDTPEICSVLNATPQIPFLSIHFLLNKKILEELLVEMSPDSRPAPCESHNIHVSGGRLEYLEFLLQLVMLVTRPCQIEVMAPLIFRELHYLLLLGNSGPMLHNLYMRGARDNRIIEAISWLKNNLDKSMRVGALAKMVNMSVSSLHRQFKMITGFSPLQYHKKLKLYEARRLMLVENERADMAAIRVGYESVTQFNREYKRMFGQPPRRDVALKRLGRNNNF